MTVEHAHLVIAAGLLVSVAVWLSALRLYLAQRRWPVKLDGRWIVPQRSPRSALNEAIGLTAPTCRVSRRGASGLMIHLGGCEALVTFSPRDRDVAMHAQIDWARGGRMFGFFMALLVLVVEPAVIFGLGGGLWHWVASSESAEVRSMATDVLQIGHVLWPPFLVYLIYRKLRQQSRRVVEKLAELLIAPYPGSAAVVS